MMEANPVTTLASFFFVEITSLLLMSNTQQTLLEIGSFWQSRFFPMKTASRIRRLLLIFRNSENGYQHSGWRGAGSATQVCRESVLSQDALAARCDRTIRLGPNPQVFRHHFRSFSRLSLSLQRAAEAVE